LSSRGRTTAGAWHYLARVYDAQKDFPHAVEAIAESIKIRPEDHSAYKTQAAIYTANGKKEEAIDAYTRAIKLKPEDAEVFFQRAQLFETMKRYDQALEDYKACVSHGPAVSQMPYKLMSLKRRAAILTQRKNFRDAVDELSLALTMDKGDEELYRLRGEAYEHLQKFDKAVVDYSKAISMAPEFSQRSYKARARCYEKLGKVDRAAADLKESKRLMDAPAEKPLYELKDEGGSAY
jgi:tetratricopeptide (TPR) repeat protein